MTNCSEWAHDARLLTNPDETIKMHYCTYDDTDYRGPMLPQYHSVCVSGTLQLAIIILTQVLL